MDLALALANRSRMSHKIGCAIVCKGRVIARGMNETVGTKRAHSTVHNVSRHAEMCALEELLRKLRLLNRVRHVLQGVPVFLVQSSISSKKKKKRRPCFGNHCKLQLDMYVVRSNLGCAKPCEECDRWLRVCRDMGIVINVYHTDRCGTICPYDGQPCSYKQKCKLW